jgi:hypothetical protein
VASSAVFGHQRSLAFTCLFVCRKSCLTRLDELFESTPDNDLYQIDSQESSCSNGIYEIDAEGNDKSSVYWKTSYTVIDDDSDTSSYENHISNTNKAVNDQHHELVEDVLPSHHRYEDQDISSGADRTKAKDAQAELESQTYDVQYVGPVQREFGNRNKTPEPMPITRNRIFEQTKYNHIRECISKDAEHTRCAQQPVAIEKPNSTDKLAGKQPLTSREINQYNDYNWFQIDLEHQQGIGTNQDESSHDQDMAIDDDDNNRIHTKPMRKTKLADDFEKLVNDDMAYLVDADDDDDGDQQCPDCTNCDRLVIEENPLDTQTTSLIDCFNSVQTCLPFNDMDFTHLLDEIRTDNTVSDDFPSHYF